ncbi:hypothetical protein PM082_016838 [Marasmius tenuissimus]|nr:hypothetical protein PM082_016838 [Marasmius tenuissimus]
MFGRELPTTIPVKRGILPPSPEIAGKTPGTKTNDKRGATTPTPVPGKTRAGRQLQPERVVGKVHQRRGVACGGGVPVIIEEVQERVSPMLESIYAMKECKAEDIEYIVGDIIYIIDGATAQVKTYIDAEVDLNVAISIDDLDRLLVGLVTSTVACIQVVLGITAQVELDATIKILASLCVSLSAFIQVCYQLGGGLAAAFAVKLAPFVGLCKRLGVDVSVTAFLKVIS